MSRRSILAAGAILASACLGLASRPAQAAPAATPTVAQLLDVANAQYLLDPIPPSGLRYLLLHGLPVQVTDEVTGLEATAYVTAANQVVIGYQGTTGGERLILNLPIVLTQIAADLQIYAQTISPAELEAVTFAKLVVQTAQAQGIPAASVFVTGHSLGGIEAEYVAQQLGLGGIGFESTGIPKSAAVGSGATFVNTVTYGDPVANYASDVSGEQPFAPAYVAGQGGSLPHYGQVVLIGTPSDQAALTAAAKPFVPGPAGTLGSLPGLLGLLGQYHLPGVQAHDLGVGLNPYSVIVDSLGSMTGLVSPAANLTIPQFAAAYATR